MMKRTFVAVLAGGLLFAEATGPALAADRHIVFVNDATKKVSAALLQSEHGKMVVVQYGDIEPHKRLTFNVPNVATVIRVKADWCGASIQRDLPVGKTHVELSQACSVVVR